MASFVVACEKVSLMTETLVAAGRVVTVLIAAAVLRETLVNVCQQYTLKHHSLTQLRFLSPDTKTKSNTTLANLHP